NSYSTHHTTFSFFFSTDTPTTEIYTLSLHDALPIWQDWERRAPFRLAYFRSQDPTPERPAVVILSQVLPDFYNLGYQESRQLVRSEEHTSELQSRGHLVCRLLLEKKK